MGYQGDSAFCSTQHVLDRASCYVSSVFSIVSAEFNPLNRDACLTNSNVSANTCEDNAYIDFFFDVLSNCIGE